MARKGGIPCLYVGSSGAACPGDAEGSAGLCFWHDPAPSKKGRDVKERLEAWTKQRRGMEGFILKGANLEGVDLDRGETRKSLNLSHADLSRANLRGAHLFNADLRGSNLFKADFEDANLNHANLSRTNLLGTDLHDARLEQVNWGTELPQEAEARQARLEGRHEAVRELYLEAEEVYRSLSRITEEKGYFRLRGRFFHREMVMRRKQMRGGSWQWAVSKFMDLICGYGELPGRVIGFSMAIILLCAVLYFAFGVSGNDGAIVFDAAAGFSKNLLAFLVCLYYSVVTFTTLGYGEIVPLGPMRAVAAAEAFTGAFTIGLFLVVFVKKLSR